MSKKVKVASIEIRYPDGESKMIPIDDARELFNQLKDLFGDKVVVNHSPVIIERDRWPRWMQTTMVTDPQPVRSVPEVPKRMEVWCCSK